MHNPSPSPLTYLIVFAFGAFTVLSLVSTGFWAIDCVQASITVLDGGTP